MHAIVRPPGDSFRQALSSHPLAHGIDPERARQQHAEYCQALIAGGVDVITLPSEERYPDSCFVDDCGVVADGAALLTRPGADSRRAEPELIEPVLVTLVDSLTSVEAPATLDGGDVLRLGRKLIVGRSGRTDDAGIAAVSAFAAKIGFDVAAVELPAGALHLQSVVTALDGDAVVCDESLLGEPFLAGVDRRVPVPLAERPACNVVGLGGHVVMPAGYPHTASAIAELGYVVAEVDLSEFVKADGGATCLSLVV